MAPRVSVVMSVYNAAPYIREAIESVFAQTATDWELVVVDDGSTDGTSEILKELSQDSRLRVYRQPEKSGTPARGRNVGVKHARGDIITFLDGDDLYHPEKLAVQLRVLDAFPHIGATFHDYLWFRSGSAPDSGTRFLEQQNYLAKAGEAYARGTTGVDDVFLGGPNLIRFVCTEQVGIHTSALAVRKSVLAQIGTPFDESLPHGEDIDCWFRIARQAPLAFIERPLSYYRFHPQSWMATIGRKTIAQGAYLVRGGMLRWFESSLPAKEWPEYRERVAAYWHGIGYRCLVAGLAEESRICFREAFARATSTRMRFLAGKGIVTSYLPISVLRGYWRLRGTLQIPEGPSTA